LFRIKFHLKVQPVGEYVGRFLFWETSMRVFPVLAILIIFFTSAIAGAAKDVYKCDITKFGQPVNFSGGYQNKHDLMVSWLPRTPFYVEVEGDSATLYASSESTIPSKSGKIESTRISFRFSDYPKRDKGRTLLRNLDFTLQTGDMTFSVSMLMNPGVRFTKARGSAFGSCVKQ